MFLDIEPPEEQFIIIDDGNVNCDNQFTFSGTGSLSLGQQTDKNSTVPQGDRLRKRGLKKPLFHPFTMKLVKK